MDAGATHETASRQQRKIIKSAGKDAKKQILVEAFDCSPAVCAAAAAVLVCILLCTRRSTAVLLCTLTATSVPLLSFKCYFRLFFFSVKHNYSQTAHHATSDISPRRTQIGPNSSASYVTSVQYVVPTVRL